MGTTYHVTVTREDNLWVAVVREPIGQQAMDYEDFGDLHRDLPVFIADMIDGDPNEITVEFEYAMNGRDVTRELLGFLMTERRLHEEQLQRDRARNEALHALLEAGLSQRAIADALGISHQRVNQLINA